MVHRSLVSSNQEIEVDHFDPTLPEPTRNRYDNLFPSLALCNGCKSDTWPTKHELTLGIRFLDPTRELDYGKSIFEDPQTKLLGGTTRAAIFHIRNLGLNDPDLVDLRKRRDEIAKQRDSLAQIDRSNPEWTRVQQALKFFDDLLDHQVPRIPPPPDGVRITVPRT